jgi:hypothetical protein
MSRATFLLRLLGKMPDAEVAARTGRSENAVRVKRTKLGIPNPSGPGWTVEELALLRQCNDPLLYVERLGYTRAPSARPWPASRRRAAS